MQPLTPIQTQVLTGLLAGQPLAAVARDNGVDRSTIYHWRKNHPHFTFALEQARAHLQTAIYDDVQDLVSQALEVLSELLHSTGDKIRLRVAQTLLSAANPMKANTILHTNMGVETLSDHVEGLPAIAAPVPRPAATIRHIATPSRNQRCPCNSGIKYKKCCGNPARPPANQGTPAAA